LTQTSRNAGKPSPPFQLWLFFQARIHSAPRWALSTSRFCGGLEVAENGDLANWMVPAKW
jgi:acyl CoA:acetate/3-ketoacid CoA transferase beta subunit